MRAENASEKILAAAERLLVQHGVGGLTFVKVAQESGVSRGGVLYHFRSKDALVQALVERFVAEFEGHLEAVAGRDPEPRGRVSRAYVAASFQPAMSGSERFGRFGSCIMAALNGSPDKLEPLREQNRRWQRRVEGDGLDPVEATIVRLAVEGLWLGEAFGTNRLEPGMRQRVIDRLLATCARRAPGPGTWRGRRRMGKPQMPADVERLTKPTVIKAADAPRFLWGDPEAGFVSDWIYGSSLKIHMMSFSMAVGQKFMNSPDFKTYYDCAETYYCQKGEFTFHCPETGEVQVIKAGEFLYIPPRTWHFGYNFGREECRIVEIITPPVRERIEDFSARHELGSVKPILDGAVGGFAGSAAGLATRTKVVRPEDYLYELHGREKPIRVGLVCSTDLLTTGVVELYPGQASEPLAHPGDKVVFVLEGMLNVRVWPTEEWWELHAGDTCFIPEGCSHSFQNCMDQRVRLMFGVAPRYR